MSSHVAAPPRMRPAQQRLAFWTDMVCDIYVQLDCDAAGRRRAAIEGEIRKRPARHAAPVARHLRAQYVQAHAARISPATEDYFLVSIQTQGRGVVRQDGRDALLRPGDFALYDSTRPYELMFEEDFQQFVLKLPGPTLRTRLRDTERLTATRCRARAGAGHLMIGMIAHAVARHRHAGARVGRRGGRQRAATSWWPGCRTLPAACTRRSRT